MLFGLNEALNMIKQEGLENVFKRHLQLSKMFRTGVEALGLELMVKDEKIASPAVTSIMLPEGIEAGKISGFFRNNGISHCRWPRPVERENHSGWPFRIRRCL